MVTPSRKATMRHLGYCNGDNEVLDILWYQRYVGKIVQMCLHQIIPFGARLQVVDDTRGGHFHSTKRFDERLFDCRATCFSAFPVVYTLSSCIMGQLYLHTPES